MLSTRHLSLVTDYHSPLRRLLRSLLLAAFRGARIIRVVSLISYRIVEWARNARLMRLMRSRTKPIKLFSFYPSYLLSGEKT